MATPADSLAAPLTDAALKRQQVMEYIWHHILNTKPGHGPMEWHPLPFVPGIHLPDWLPLHQLMLLIAGLLLIVGFCVLYRLRKGVPTHFSIVLETFIVFIRDEVAIPSLGEHDGKKLTPLLCTFFFFILVLNFMGLFPFFVTATANVHVTAALSILVFVVMIVGGLLKNGPLGLAHAFIPGGVPLVLKFVLFPLEVVGVFIKTFALTLRLFANMLAGHVAIFSIIGMVVVFGPIALPALLMALFILLIEVLVALLQAYVFTLLSAVFIGQVFHPEH